MSPVCHRGAIPRFGRWRSRRKCTCCVGPGVFCHDKYNFTAKHYLENTNKAYEDFCTISTRIRKEIRDDQIKGGMVGQYNPSITARLNALKEQIEQTNIEQPLFPDVSKDNGDK